MIFGGANPTHRQRVRGGAHFKDENLEITGSPLSTYEYRSDESHRWIRLEFCPRCGTTVTLASEQSPGGNTVSELQF
ncbi:MAG: GFA family protein [Burkholderiales bacterium]